MGRRRKKAMNKDAPKPATRYLYFAYGSNMNKGQMAYRAPTANMVGPAVLADWALVESGCADIVKQPGASVDGALWLITDEDLAALDRYEGYPTGYTRGIVSVVSPDYNGTVQALTYWMTAARGGRGSEFSHSYAFGCAYGAYQCGVPISPLYLRRIFHGGDRLSETALKDNRGDYRGQYFNTGSPRTAYNQWDDEDYGDYGRYSRRKTEKSSAAPADDKKVDDKKVDDLVIRGCVPASAPGLAAALLCDPPPDPKDDPFPDPSCMTHWVACVHGLWVRTNTTKQDWKWYPHVERPANQSKDEAGLSPASTSDAPAHGA